MTKLITTRSARLAVPLIATIAGIAAVSLAAGCGGGGADEAAVATEASLKPAAPAAKSDYAGVAPSDPGARTRTGAYLSSASADRLEQTTRDGVVHVKVECCGAAGVEQALAIAYGMQAAHDLPRSATFLVRGDDLRLAAVVADRLGEQGMTRVYLVTR